MDTLILTVIQIMEYELKQINAISVVKIIFVVFFFLGVIGGIIYVFTVNTISSLIYDISDDTFEYIPASGSAIEIFIQIFSFALFTALVNCIISVLFVVGYNVLASVFGGIKFYLENKEPTQIISENQ